MQYNIQLLLCSLLIRDTLMLRLDKTFTFVLDLTMNTLNWILILHKKSRLLVGILYHT